MGGNRKLLQVCKQWQSSLWMVDDETVAVLSQRETFLIQKEQNMSLKAALLPVDFGKHCNASQLAHVAVLLAGI